MGRHERLVSMALRVCAVVPVALSVALLGLLVGGAWRAGEGLSIPPGGIAPLIAGTVMVAGLAAAIAVPLGSLAAIYLGEFAPPRRRRWLKPALELLAGIPTIVYGIVAVMVVGPWLHRLWPSIEVYSGVAASLVLALMILPSIASLSEDALRTVPRQMREASLALGASRLRMLLLVVLPAARPGIMAATMLAISRAIGETMIMTLAAGPEPPTSLDPVRAVETLTSIQGRAALLGNDDASMYSAGLVLLVLSLLTHGIAQRLIRFPQPGRWQ